MSEKVTAAVLEGPGKVVIKEFSRPQIGPEEGLLKIELAGVCSTDGKYYMGKMTMDYPVIMGHELLGHIDEIGEKAAERYGLKKGDRVVVEGTIPCGQCFYCLTGNYHHCDNRKSYGVKVSSRYHPHLWGGYTQYMYLAPGSKLHPISEDVPTEAAVLTTSVIANGIEWVRKAGGASIGDVVVIQGVGQQGLSAIIAAKESGAEVIATGMAEDQERFEFARLFGADHVINVEETDPVAAVKELTGGRMADLVVDLTGNPQGIVTSLDLVRKQGTMVTPGITGAKTITPVPWDKIVFKAVKVQGIFSKTAESIRRAIKLIESQKYPLEKIITHRYPIRETETALKAVARQLPGENPVKVIMDPWN